MKVRFLAFLVFVSLMATVYLAGGVEVLKRIPPTGPVEFIEKSHS